MTMPGLTHRRYPHLGFSRCAVHLISESLDVIRRITYYYCVFSQASGDIGEQ